VGEGFIFFWAMPVIPGVLASLPLEKVIPLLGVKKNWKKRHALTLE